MKTWFDQLDARERLLVSIAALLAVFALIVVLGIRPIMQQTARGEARVSQKQQLLSELERLAERLGPQTGGAEIAAADGGEQSLVVVIDRTTRANGLAPYLKRNQPDGANAIRLRLENAPFDVIVEWLGLLSARYGLTATSANIDTAGAAGRINCNLTLSRGG